MLLKCTFSVTYKLYLYLLRLQMHWQIPDSYPVYFQKSDLTVLDFTLFFFFFSAPTFISQIPICGPVRGEIWNWVTWTMKVVNPASRQHDQPRKQWYESQMLMLARILSETFLHLTFASKQINFPRPNIFRTSLCASDLKRILKKSDFNDAVG